MPQGMSVRAYARRRGVSHTAVQKAIRSGRIKAALLPDGSIDAAVADRAWAANTDETKSSNSVSGDPRHRRTPGAPPSPARSRPRGADEPPPPGGGEGGPADPVDTGYGRARGAREGYVALLKRIEYETRIGQRVLREEVELAGFATAQRTREALLAMPRQLGPILVGIDNLDQAIEALDKWARRTCEDLSVPILRPAPPPPGS